MNHLGGGLFDPVGLAGFRESLRALVSDPDAAVSFSLTTPTARSFDPASGVETPTSTTDALTGWRAPLSEREASESEVYQTGDVRFIVDASTLSVPATSESTISYSGTTYRVVNVETDPLDALVHLVSRSAG